MLVIQIARVRSQIKHVRSRNFTACSTEYNAVSHSMHSLTNMEVVSYSASDE